jgi:hypothetical protein
MPSVQAMTTRHSYSTIACDRLLNIYMKVIRSKRGVFRDSSARELRKKNRLCEHVDLRKMIYVYYCVELTFDDEIYNIYYENIEPNGSFELVECNMYYNLAWGPREYNSGSFTEWSSSHDEYDYHRLLFI